MVKGLLKKRKKQIFKKIEKTEICSKELLAHAVCDMVDRICVCILWLKSSQGISAGHRARC